MAVFTPVSDDEARAFLEVYDLGALVALDGILQGVSNTTFRLTTSTGRYILTLYEAARTNPDDLPFFMNLMDHLATHGIPCPAPVRGKDGRVLRTLNGRPAAVVTFLEGKSTPETLTPAMCAEAGLNLAKLHEAGRTSGLTRSDALGVTTWEAQAATCAPRADTVSAGLASLIQDEARTLARTWPTDVPTGVIHADFFPNNVFFKDDRLCGIFDFYFACTGVLAYELMIVMNAWCFERSGAFNVTKARALVRAYQSIRPLEPSEREALPILARGASMRFLLSRLYDWLNPVPGALVRTWDPRDYLARLLFHRDVTSLAAYGLETL